MRHRRKSPARRLVGCALLVVLAAGSTLSTGCKPRDIPATAAKGSNVVAGTVQATMSVPPSTAPGATTVPAPAPTAPAAPQPAPSGSGAGDLAQAPLQNQATPPKSSIWPAKVGTYAANVKIPVWYPKTMPAGYKLDTVDVVEFDPGSGLVCDIVWLNGDKIIHFMQGSPNNRSYDIVSIGKTKWASESADIVHDDPSDATTPVTVVLSKDGNFAELSGDVGLEQLKAIAASMVRVK